MKKAYSYLRFSSTGQKDGDSLERQLRIATAYHDRALKSLPLDSSRGDEVHIVNINVVLALGWENDWRRYPVDAELERAWKESSNKSERCGSAWTKKRHNADGKAAMSSRVPNWLKAEKGKPIQVNPERAKVVRQIFEWAAQGLGQYQIADKLIAAKLKPCGSWRHGMEPRWTPTYVR